MGDACRLYQVNKPRLGSQGWDHRKYCAKRSHFSNATEDEVNIADDFCYWLSHNVMTWPATKQVALGSNETRKIDSFYPVSLLNTRCYFPYSTEDKKYGFMVVTQNWHYLVGWHGMSSEYFTTV